MRSIAIGVQHNKNAKMELVLERLATLIPDIVIQKPISDHLPQTIHSYGVIVFADISGIPNSG